MIDYINKWEKMDKSVHKNSRLHRYSALKEVERTFPALVCSPWENSL